jgi:ferredoxin-NADP reductase
VAERGAPPKVSARRRRILGAVRAFTSPLLPDDYLELINPLWSTRELRGRIERITRETPDAVTILIRPGYEWEGHEPGQYLRIGIDVDGVRHWRAYSLTSDPARPDGFISVTPKLVPEGKVTPALVQRGRVGTLVGLGGVEGEFVLPDETPERILFLSAGSGVTPIMSMIRSLGHAGELADVVHIHSARDAEDVIFGRELREMARRHEGFRLHEHHTGAKPRLTPRDLDELCPDWREREAFVSGPGELLDDIDAWWETEGEPARLHMERFQPRIIDGDAEHGDGGTITFTKSKLTAECDGGTPILVAGEEAGASLPFGCREGICHTCVGELRSGRIRDLRTGKVHGQEGENVRTCIHAPEGDVEIAL